MMNILLEKKVEKIKLLVKIHHYEKAEAALLKVEKEFPGSFQEHCLAELYAVCLYKQNKTKETLEFLKKEISKHPHSSSLKLCLSACLADMGAYSEASELFLASKNAFALLERHLKAQFKKDLGIFKKSKNALKESLEDFESYYIESLPSLESVLLIARTYLRDKKPVLASQFLEKNTKEYEKSYEIYTLLGLSYYLQKDLSLAQKSWRRALELNPAGKESKVLLDQTLNIP